MVSSGEQCLKPACVHLTHQFIDFILFRCSCVLVSCLFLFLTSSQTTVLFLPSAASLLCLSPSELSHFHSSPSISAPSGSSQYLSLLTLFYVLFSLFVCICNSSQNILFLRHFPLSLWSMVSCTNWHATISCPSPKFIYTLGTTLHSTGREQERVRKVVLAGEDVESQGSQTRR